MSVVNRFVNIAAVLLSITAVISVGLIAKRTFASPAGTAVTAIEDWKPLAAGRPHLGPDSASVSIVVFSDIRCPHCRQAWITLSAILREHPRDVSVVYRHFPLTLAMYSGDAARASECAARAGKLAGLFDVFQANRDSLTFIDSLSRGSWNTAARRAGVDDTTAFNKCMLAPEVHRQIQDDITLGRSLKVTGVPTMFINGTRVVGDDEATLRRVVAAALRNAGR